MVVMFRLIALSVIIFLSENVYSLSAKDVYMKDMFETLQKLIVAGDAANEAKMAALEAEFKERQEASELEIYTLKQKIKSLESDFKSKELAMQDEINTLRSAIKSETDDDSSEHHSESRISDDQKHHVLSNPIKRQGIIRDGREFPETEVAFYATHRSGQIHHLGDNQILPFQMIVTNVGNAFNNNTGSFVAPVDGTYVFHATILAIDTASGKHFRAHFDINGSSYSVFYITSYDQSSQMLVIDLKAGDTAVIKNDFTDLGIYGHHHTTFSGFLLYEHSPTVAVVGK
ncbi:positive regulation of adiponectin secretion [Mactra antiquata]